MKNLAFAVLALLLSATLLAPGVTAQTPDDSPFHPLNLVADGWTETSTGLWTRSLESGVVQKIAFDEGRLELVPKLQAELDRLTQRVAVEPRPELFDSMDQIVSLLAEIHDRPEARLESKRAAPPPVCYPWFLSTSTSAWIDHPPAAHSYVAYARAQWLGNGFYCPGHVYTRAEYSYYSTLGHFYDLEYCAADDNFQGWCQSLLYYPSQVPTNTLISCSSEAFLYMTVYNGAVVISQEAETNSCF